LSGYLLLRESPFHIVNCLKSFDFLKLLSGPIWHMMHIIFALFWKTYDLLQSLLNVAPESFISF